jgi:hypothetical protein
MAATGLPAYFNSPRRIALIPAILAVSNLLLFGPGWSPVGGMFLLCVVLSGALAAICLLTKTRTSVPEFVVVALGLGYCLFILVLYGLSLLPGGVSRWEIVLAFDALCLALMWQVLRLQGAILEPEEWLPPDAKFDTWAVIALASVLIVAAVLRFPDLGYSEFDNDEVRMIERSAEVVQGYESALFIHRKGPAEILIPAGIYAVGQRIDEAQARVFFTIANIVGLLAVFLLGWRMFGLVAGWMSAMLLATDGLFTGFARFAQYQSIVIAMSAIVILMLHRQAKSSRLHNSYLWIAGFCFVTGAYAHYEIVWVVIPGAYLMVSFLQRSQNPARCMRAAALPAFVVSALLAFFYVPFVLDTNWASTARNIIDTRIGNAFPYNNLTDFVELATIYSSRYQMFFVAVGSLAALALALHRYPNPRIMWILAGAMIVVLVRPDWLRTDKTDFTWLLFVLAVVAAVLSPHASLEERTVWLWFGVPLVLSLFFAALPNTHVYGFYMGWVLLTGSVVEIGWQKLGAWESSSIARPAVLLALVAAIAVFGIYTFLLFAYTRVEILRTWAENRPVGYWTTETLPDGASLFGFPFKNGWKVIGMLFADGTLDAPFDANVNGRTGYWYTHGPHYCPPDAEFYMLATELNPSETDTSDEKLHELFANGYHEWGYVTVNGEPRLRILAKRPADGDEPHVFDEAEYDKVFDETLTSPFYVKPGPALLVKPNVKVDYRLGDSFWLRGYSLAPDAKVKPGDRISLELFWETTQPEDIEDKVFVQILDTKTLHKSAQRDAEPGCTIYSIDDWRPGDLNYDPYSLQILPDTPPGTYTVLVGIYDDRVERYPVFSAGGDPLGDAISLTTIQVVSQ